MKASCVKSANFCQNNISVTYFSEVRKTFKFKLYQSRKNRYLHRQIDLAASIYNHCIALHKRYYRMFGRHLNVFALKKHITKIKHFDKYIHWNALGSQTIQDVVIRIDKAYQNFFRSLKTKRRGKVSTPGFKKRRRYKSFTLTQAGYKVLEGNRIRIGEKIFNYHKPREIEGIIKTLTIKRDALGEIYLFFSCDRIPETAVQNRVMTGKSAGCDFGLKRYLTLSNGNSVESPHFFKGGIKKVKQANKALSRKKKGSENRSRARKDYVRAHRKIANQRLDFSFKLAREMAIKHDYLFFEDLNIAAMKQLWGRKVSDLGFADHLIIQEHMCRKLGSTFVKIARYYPSSKQCHKCGCINKNLELRDRTWICPTCGVKHNRDGNASKVIHMVGASDHWERSNKTACVVSSSSASIPESHML